MNDAAVLKAYKRYARKYDLLFGKVFEHGRRLLIDKMDCRGGENILEVGVGTGLSLPIYPDSVSVAGIDLSPHMLGVARRRLNGSSGHRRALLRMDAQRMSFADNCFDKVAAMYIVSVVPQPSKMMSEIRRVCRPGGDIFILNHFSNQNFIPRVVETAMVPFEKFIGFKPRFALDSFLEEAGLEVVETCPVNLFGFWTLIHAKNTGCASREFRQRLSA
ncbi:MAG: class I SAM-dependent methyltransferase [Deltaproteobacteria bacterium]|nr:class I SAM-dependent methyltransferase [Deltaproteobacteria bacterium]